MSPKDLSSLASAVQKPDPITLTDSIEADKAGNSHPQILDQASLERILNAIADPVFVKDDQHRLIILNDAYCQFVGRSREEIIGSSEYRVFSKEEADQFWRSDDHVLTTGAEYEQEEYLTDAHGELHVISTKKSLSYDVAGNPIIIGAIRDITARKQAEIALKQQAERERLLGAIAQYILKSPDIEQLLNKTAYEIRRFLKADRLLFYSLESGEEGVIAESLKKNRISLKQATLKEMGVSSAAISQCAKGDVKIIEDIRQAHLSSVLVARMEALEIKASLVIPIMQGERLWGLILAHRCRQARQWTPWEVESLKELATQIGSTIRQAKLYQQVQQLNTDLEREVQQRTTQLQIALDFEATLKRITDRVRDSLDENQILQTAVKELTEALNVKGSNTSLYDLEQGTSTIFHEYTTSLSSSQGRVSQMEAFPEVYHQLLEGQYFQFCSVFPNPVRGHVAMFACPILDDRDVLGDLWLIHDKDHGFGDIEIRLVQQVANQCAIAIRQARLYQAAQSQVAELERLNTLKDDFLSTVSHELRTPVTSMKVALQLLGITLNQEFSLDEELRKPRTEQDRLARYYQILQEECEREITLINDLLDLQRLDLGNHPITPQTIELHEWLPGIVDSFQTRAKNRNQELQLHLPPDLPTLVSDLASLERVLAELLNNACKYTPPGEQIKLKVVTLPADKIQVVLSNTGIEIPADELPRIFDKFYRVPSSDPWRQGGTGLGLALVQKLILHLQGDIQVASSNKTTRFTVELPLKLSELTGSKANL
ncbi:MAG: GAF domain-containing protein [Leptolyngbyaceae cyanobacterium MO_188.B28]|nr:GAF domain-containing protein [Leptolyngbyaceae cyanobacterium MO_188.B28]